MDHLKIKKRNVVIKNIIIFLLLSYLFLYIQNAFRQELSPFSVAYLRKSMEEFWYVILIVLLSINTIWNQQKQSRFMYQLVIALVSFHVLEGLFLDFNKIVVIAFFIFLVTSFFLYQFLASYMKSSVLNPNFHKSDLFDPMLKKIPCQIQDKTTSVEGFLTNWDEEGCFIRLSSPYQFSKKINLSLTFKDRDFVQEGELVAVTPDLKGVGLQFRKTTKKYKQFNWSEFIEIVNELGLLPERLR